MLWSITAAATLAYAVAAILVTHSRAPITSYAGASGAARFLDLAAGIGLLAAGLLALHEPSRVRCGALTLIAGILWFGPDWEGWAGGPELVRSTGALAPPLLLALMVHLILSFPDGRLRARHERVVVIAVYSVSAAAAASRALVRDPFLDPYCWRDCLGNSFLVHASPGIALAIDDLWQDAAFLIAATLIVCCATRILTASRAALGQCWPGLASGVLLGAATAIYAAALRADPLEQPQRDVLSAIFKALALSAITVAIAVAWTAVQARRRREIVRRLAFELSTAPQPGGLENALATAVGDPSLRVLYRLSDSDRMVDHRGLETGIPPTDEDHTVTPMTRAGEMIAAAIHDPEIDGAGLARQIGPAARLAIENERLHAEVLARLQALQASRARITATADRERRRLERNLHDGAQQRMLALSYHLRLARAAADESLTGKALVSRLSAGIEDADTALMLLRQLAEGIYPAILTEAGLEPALTSLAERAQIAVELEQVPLERFPETVEATAYVTVAEAVDDAAGRGATFIAVSILFDEGAVAITTRDDGRDRASPLTHLGDRVGAIGGAISARAKTLKVRIPCA